MKPTTTLITIVFSDEVNSLGLQAASIQRYFRADDIGSIKVIINDIEEESVTRKVGAIMHYYGDLADKVEIVAPLQILAPRSMKLWLKRSVVHLRNLAPFRLQRGWRGNNGWMMQQAFKLCSARLVEDDYVLILDAKNFFVKPVGLHDFFAEDGRALSFLEEPSNAQRNWMQNAFRIFGVAPPKAGSLIPPSTTPYPVRADVLSGCLAAAEDTLGPLEGYFGSRKVGGNKGTKASEFMLIYAFVEKAKGGWDAVFSDGLRPAASVNRRMDDAAVDQMIDLVESGDSKVFGVHHARIRNLNSLQRERILAILQDRGLADAGQFLR